MGCSPSCPIPIRPRSRSATGPDVPHDSPDCAAWIVPDGTRITLAADGDTLYLLHEDVDGGAWLDARSLTDDSIRLLCALPQMECDREYQWELAAADGAYLYLNAASYPSRVDLSVPHEERAGVMSVSKTDGAPRLYENRETPPADNSPAGRHAGEYHGHYPCAGPQPVPLAGAG